MSGSGGYTFPLMLVILTAIAFGTARLELTQSYRVKRDKEEELLFRGLAYMKAIQAFHAAEATEKRYPRKLEELISDPRAPGRRFIRQLYKDPMTGGDFHSILAPEGTIVGVFSASTAIPFRKIDFDKGLAAFDKAKSYADWRFTVKAQGAAPLQNADPASQGLQPDVPPMTGISSR